jgi:hypothetical protein
MQEPSKSIRGAGAGIESAKPRVKVPCKSQARASCKSQAKSQSAMQGPSNEPSTSTSVLHDTGEALFIDL